MHTLSGLYDDYVEAQLVVRDLEDFGVSSDDITLMSRGSAANDADSVKMVGAGVGATLGGTGGLLAGMAGTAIPGIGPAVGVGWLLSALAGAAAGGVAGGLVAALVDAGIDDSEAHVLAEGLKRGAAIVTVRAHEHEVISVSRILSQHSPVDIHARRREYENAGWTGFSSEGLWDDRMESEGNKEEGRGEK